MACITEKKNKNGTSWQVLIRIPGTPKICKNFDDRTIAEKFARLTEIQLRREQGLPTQSRAQKAIASQFLNERLSTSIAKFLAGEAARPRHIGHAPTVLKYIGDVRVSELRRSWIKDFIAILRSQTSYRGKAFTWGTIHGYLSFIGRVVRWRANDLDQPAPLFPYSKTLLPEGWDEGRERRLEAGEYDAIMRVIRMHPAASNFHYRLLVRLALETGARLQELVLAEWREINAQQTVWTIPAAHTKCKKTRVVPLSKVAIRIVKLLKLIADPTSKRLFHTISNAEVASAMFRRMTRKAGVIDFHFHDLRHEAISRMVIYKRKLSVFEIMAIVGHSSMEMLQRYANLRGDEFAGRMD